MTDAGPLFLPTGASSLQRCDGCGATWPADAAAPECPDCGGEGRLVRTDIMEVEIQGDGQHVIEHLGAKVFIDHKSTSFLAGCTLDYEDGLSGAGFRIRNPRAARS